MKSFAELERSETVSVTDLKATLKDYAESGAAILGRVVVAIINRTSLTHTDQQELLASANRGVEVHRQMRESCEVREYQEVVNRLSS